MATPVLEAVAISSGPLAQLTQRREARDPQADGQAFNRRDGSGEQPRGLPSDRVDIGIERRETGGLGDEARRRLIASGGGPADDRRPKSTTGPSTTGPSTTGPTGRTDQQGKPELPGQSGQPEKAEGKDGELSEAQQEQIRELSARDVEVRRHEEAHARVGGVYAGQPTYSYQTGPDGKRYAIGGEVSIDVSPIPDDPEATIVKMRVVKSAALAPAEPSGADRRVAALADSQRLQAQADLNAERVAEALESFGAKTGEADTDPSRTDKETDPAAKLLDGVRAIGPVSQGDGLDRAA